MKRRHCVSGSRWQQAATRALSIGVLVACGLAPRAAHGVGTKYVIVAATTRKQHARRATKLSALPESAIGNPALPLAESEPDSDGVLTPSPHEYPERKVIDFVY